MHFTPMGGFGDAELPIIVRGEGCYVYDDHGNRYLDGLAALFCVNIGHGRADVAQAGADQAKELAFYTNWGYAHPRAIELAARVAELAPGDLNRVFFTSGGSRGGRLGAQALPPVPQADRQPGRFKVISRKLAYHGTTLGALTATGIPALRRPFEPLFPGGATSPTRTPTGPRGSSDPAEAIRERILFEGPETVSCVILEPVQNSGGCFPPPEGYFQRVREICDEFGIVFISDEVICSWGRLGTYFGAEKYGYVPDIITTAKGLTSSYAPMGAVIASDRVVRAVHARHELVRPRHHVRRAPGRAAVALANLDVFEQRGDPRARARARGRVPAMLDSAARHPDRRRRARHGLLPRDRARQATARPRRRSPARRQTGCCAASSRRSCSAAG